MANAAEFEKLGVFYLGRRWDADSRRAGPHLLLYDSKDLVTHAVCVGMTGSGKTGLCIAILEEAGLDGIPAIAIDPKGDIANLMLTFPDLAPDDFRPWIDEDEARRRGLDPAEYARQEAERWKAGLAEWGQDGARIRRFRETADIAIYTPGSEAGIPVSMLKSLSAPPLSIRDDPELLRERISTTATGLLGLVGVAADPVKSREHILISTLLDRAWRDGRDVDLPALIAQIQTPALARVGVLDLESFYPSGERFELAMALNNLLAAPGFAAWMAGEPLDVGRALATPEGKPRIAIFSIAHLGEGERMFFVSLLLNEILAWTRAQSGTASLRAIVYMDEIFGYFPPVANPPAKQPLLTLLKQARAHGVGLLLATQNPVDLDYKGLANAGTWLIGRLQTERDRARLLDGLEVAATAEGTAIDRRQMDEIVAGLGQRVFAMRNVHEPGVELFQTRWAMSYLRGPLTRSQIRTLMAGRAAAVPAPAGTAPGPAPAPSAAAPTAPARSAAPVRPLLDPGVPQHFIPVRGQRPAGATLVYRPMLLGVADVRFADARKGVDVAESVCALAPITADAVAVDWDRADDIALDPADLDASPADGASFEDVPPAASKGTNYARWQKDFAAWLFRTRRLELLHCPRLKLYARPGESEADFRARLLHAGHEQRDQALERLRKKYAPKIAALEARKRRAEQAVARESEQVGQQKLQTVISLGTTLIGAILGRKAVSASTLGRATTTARGAGRVLKERQDVERAQETLRAVERELADLDAAFRAEVDALSAVDAAAEPLEALALRPSKQNVSVRLVALAWTPFWQGPGGAMTPAYV